MKEVFEASYWRTATATVDGKTFADAFYDAFLDASPEARELFARTDFTFQKRMFLLAIVYMADLHGRKEPGHVLRRVARRHRFLGIRPEMFDQWTVSLLETVRAYDPDCDDNVLQAWQEVLGPGIRYMVSVCESRDTPGC